MNKFIRFAVTAAILSGFYSWGYADARRRFSAKPEIGGGDGGGGEPAEKPEPIDDRATALYRAGAQAVVEEFSATWAELQARGDRVEHSDSYVGPTQWFEPLTHKYADDEPAAGLDQYGRKYLVGKDLAGATTVFFERGTSGGDTRICYQTMHRNCNAVENPTESVATMRLWRAAR